MHASGTITASSPASRRDRVPDWLKGWLLLAPVLLLFIVIYFGGLSMVLLTSVSYGDGLAPAEFNLRNYYDAITAPMMGTIVMRTLRVSAATAVFTFILGFPVARYLTSPSARYKGIVLLAVLSPLMISTIGRLIGWVALFGPGSFIASFMMQAFGSRPTGLLYTEPAMVIGLTNLFLPFMVLSIVASRANFDTNLPRAASSLGATPMAVLRQIELPLSLPGIVGGLLIVFSLSIGNFVTAILLGGSGRNVLAYEIYLDTLIYFRQGRGAAMAVMLFAVELLLLASVIGITKRMVRFERPGRSH